MGTKGVQTKPNTPEQILLIPLRKPDIYKEKLAHNEFSKKGINQRNVAM